MGAVISTTEAEKILNAARDAHPNEACGLLIGTMSGAERQITQVLIMQNCATDPQRSFEIDPQAHFDALRDAQKDGKAVLGHFHSHPIGRAEPSKTDHARAYDPAALWIIAAPQSDGGVLAAFQVTGQGAEKLVPTPLQIID